MQNVYRLRDAVSRSRSAVVGDKGPGALGTSSHGDVHVVDVASWSAMHEVAFFRVGLVGTYNVSVDEGSGVLFAACYHAGGPALDVFGDLSSCLPAARDALNRCDLAMGNRPLGPALMTDSAYIWGWMARAAA